MAMFTRSQLYSTGNQPRTKLIFSEFGETENTLLTLNENPNYPSLKRLFQKFVVDDPTEATFALEVFGELEYWISLQKSPFMNNYLPKWREEADILRKSNAFKHVLNEVKEDGKNAYAAAKYLIEEPWNKKRSPAQRKATTKKAVQPIQKDVERLKEAGLFH